MNNIPLLKVTTKDYRTLFCIDTSTDDFFDCISTKYPNVILDIFREQLTANSEELKSLSSEYFRLKNEGKYLNFLEEVFLENKEQCYIHIDFKNDYSGLIVQLNNMDLIDKLLYLQQQGEFGNTGERKFLIDDLNILKMFVKAILREDILLNLYFPDKPLLLFGNYDLSLPLVFKNTEDENYYKQIAEKHSLYFR